LALGKPIFIMSKQGLEVSPVEKRLSPQSQLFEEKLRFPAFHTIETSSRNNHVDLTCPSENLYDRTVSRVDGHGPNQIST
jgi:hypothetical protein